MISARFFSSTSVRDRSIYYFTRQRLPPTRYFSFVICKLSRNRIVAALNRLENLPGSSSTNWRVSRCIFSGNFNSPSIIVCTLRSYASRHGVRVKSDLICKSRALRGRDTCNLGIRLTSNLVLIQILSNLTRA